MNNIAILMASVICFGLGFSLGHYRTESEYQEILLQQANEYKKNVEEAKKLEQHWKNQAVVLENEYQEKITSIQHSNAELVDRLRKQLDDYSNRMSENSDSSSKSDADNGKARVSKEVNRLIEFSERCSKRADELILQVNALQDWIKRYN